MKQRHRKHRRPVRDMSWSIRAWRWKPVSNAILLAPNAWDELGRPADVDGTVNLLRGEIGMIDCDFRILPLVPSLVESVVVSETLAGLAVDPEAKPA